MANIGLIFCAGNETRFNSNIPKALSVINGKCILDYNIGILSNYCDSLYVVCSTKNKQWFSKYKNICIKSGKGCGDAVLKSLLKLSCSKSDKLIINWGDCVVNEQVVKETVLLSNNAIKETLFIPCTFEEMPYVRLIQNGEKVNVEFGKYGEVKGKGLHDFGLFIVEYNYILKHLTNFFYNHYDINTNTYIHKHGNEMQFLDVVNESEIKSELVVFNCNTMSFNTKEELKKIKL